LFRLQELKMRFRGCAGIGDLAHNPNAYQEIYGNDTLSHYVLGPEFGPEWTKR
jgi:hypothetical protein